MPRQELINFKNDPTSQMVAQMTLWVKGDPLADELRDYWSTFKNRLNEIADDKYKENFRRNNGQPDPEYELLKQAVSAAAEFDHLINVKAFRNRSSDPEKMRDIIIDATKLMKKLQELMQVMYDNKIYIVDPKINHMGATGFFQPDSIKTFFIDNGRIVGGKEMINSYLFNENNNVAVEEFDKTNNLPLYEQRLYFDNPGAQRRSFDSEDPVPVKVPNQARPVRRNANNQNAAPNNQINIVNAQPQARRFKKGMIGEILDEPIEGVNIEPNRMNELSKAVTLNSMKAMVHEAKNNGPYIQKMRQFKQELTNLQKQINDNPGMLEHEEEIKSFISNEYGEGILNRVTFFMDNLDRVAEKKNPTDEDYMKLYSAYNNGANDDIETITQILNKVQDNPNIGAPLKKQCKLFADETEKIMANQAKTLENADAFEKYIALHSAPVSSGMGQSGAEHLAKVVAAYQWKQKAMAIENPEKRPAFRPDSIDKAAKDVIKNPVFRGMFTKKQGDQVVWNSDEIKDIADKNRAFKVLNRMEEPFMFDSRPDLQREALRKLKELGQIMPTSDGASKDYKRFNAYMKSLNNLDPDNIDVLDLGYTLGKVYRETEKYMKGRKSERMTDTQQEHFNETLDVLAILAKTGKIGQALADKLVNRTNEVRTNAYHRLFSEKTVSLEGRSNEATKHRIDVLEGRIKPNVQAGPRV